LAKAVPTYSQSRKYFMSQRADYIFLHGGGQGSWVWGATISALEQQTGGNFGQVLTLDVPGCGSKRRRVTEKLQFDDIIDELVLDIEGSGLEDIVLVGHSQGGQGIAALADHRPDLVRRLIYVSCSIPLPGQTLLEMMGHRVHRSNDKEVGWTAVPATTDPQALQEMMFCNDMTPTEKQAFLAELGADNWPMSSYSFTEWEFENLEKVPATYVLCERDKIIPVAWQERFAERFLAERTVRIDAGHQVMISRPHALAEVLRIEAAS
jgi:pimeloyl-ACP methyl ester carboxylesterase